MVKTNNFELQVVLENGAHFSYQNPSDTVCIEFSDCPNWKAAKSVLWRNLPAQWSIDFYQRNGCLASNGDVYHWTGKHAEDGLHTFKTPRAIRSIYARPLWGIIPWNVARKCVQLRQHSKRAESTQFNNETASSSSGEVNATEWATVGSNVEEGSSSNWFDPIEDEEEEDGSDDKEWQPIVDMFMSG